MSLVRCGGRMVQRRSTRKRLLKLCFLQSYKCHYCSGKMLIDKTISCNHPQRATLDHMIPLSKGGVSNLSNLVACCRKCNGEKDNKTIMEYLDRKVGLEAASSLGTTTL